MWRCFATSGCLGPKQAECELLEDAAGDQQIFKSTSSSRDQQSWGDTVAKRDQARPAAQNTHKQLPLAKLPAAPSAALYPYILQHGRGILSLSTLQQGLQHFVVPGVGYIAFTMMRNGPDILNLLSPLALGDPICHTANYGVMAKAFLQQHPKAIFMQISAEFAGALEPLGLLVNSMGGETVLDLATYTFSGYAKRGLRSAIAAAAKSVVVQEVMQAPLQPQLVLVQATGAGAGSTDWAGLVSEMREVDREWLARKGKHAGRFWFINRLPVFAPEPGVRKFIARESASGRLLGFIFFDAVYEGGALVGYYANVTRMRPDAHPGALNLLVKEFIDRVREESQLAAPAKKLSMRRSLRRKLEQQAAAATASGVMPASAAAAAPAAAGSSADPAAAGGSNSSVRFLSLGLAPLHQMDDSRFTHSSKVRSVFEASFNHGAAYYPFKPLAAAKAKYGAGLHQGRFEDPSVTYQQAYLAHSCYGTSGAVAMFDIAKTVGLWKHPADAASIFLRYKLKQGMQKAKAKLQKQQQQQQQQPLPSVLSTGKDGTTRSSCNPVASSARKVAAADAGAAAAAAGGGGKHAAAPAKAILADDRVQPGLVRMGSVISDASLIGTADANGSTVSSPGSSQAQSSRGGSNSMISNSGAAGSCSSRSVSSAASALDDPGSTDSSSSGSAPVADSGRPEQ